MFFFFNDTATTEIYTLSLHDALPILDEDRDEEERRRDGHQHRAEHRLHDEDRRRHRQQDRRLVAVDPEDPREGVDRKSTRLNSSHANISYAVFCLKKKTIQSFISQRS